VQLKNRQLFDFKRYPYLSRRIHLPLKRSKCWVWSTYVFFWWTVTVYILSLLYIHTI